MKKIKCLIVDDEKLAQEVLIHHISKFDVLQLVGVCNNVFELMSILNKNKDIELIYLDIKMPEINGIDFISMVNNPPAIIYVTAYSEYAINAFNQNALDYLLKPVSLERFSQSVQKASSYLSKSVNETTLQADSNDDFFVKSDKRLMKINPRNIILIEGMRNYVCLYTTTDKIIVHSTLTTMEENLKHLPFIGRIHKSFFINYNHIMYIEQHQILMSNKKNLPIGLSYRNEVYQKFKVI